MENVFRIASDRMKYAPFQLHELVSCTTGKRLGELWVYLARLLQVHHNNG